MAVRRAAQGLTIVHIEAITADIIAGLLVVVMAAIVNTVVVRNSTW